MALKNSGKQASAPAMRRKTASSSDENANFPPGVANMHPGDPFLRRLCFNGGKLMNDYQ